MAEKTIEKITKLMQNPDKIRNICTSAHIDHGKTTFSDNLMAGAGMMSTELAGQQRALDFHEDEQQRGITIDAASVTMVHTTKEGEFLINLIDTPGHVDFGGDVTRAMRAIDGTILLVDAVEGIMPQTETVLRQALKERVKPVLFINKVDRLIKELKLTPEAMQEKFIKIISNVNQLIEAIVEPSLKGKWTINVNEGTVAFGSAVQKWALSVPYMQEKQITFKEVIETLESEDKEKLKQLTEKAPLHEVVLNMSIKHHPTPKQAQKYRIEKIWGGEDESENKKYLENCDPNGPVAFVCTKVVVDKHAGEIATGRLFSGTIKQGMEINTIAGKNKVRIQQVSIYNGAKRELIEEATAGNIVGIVGLKDVFAGETASTDPNFEPFESIKHIFDPVVTKAVKATSPSDLPKLVEILRAVNKEDPTITIQINEETGEHLMSGMGELHLEITENRIKTEKGIKITTSPPIVVYRESVSTEGPVIEGKSPNKHNKFYMKAEPLPTQLQQRLAKGDIKEGRLKKKDMDTWKQLEEGGMNSKISRKVTEINQGSILIDGTRGEVHIGEVIEMVAEAFRDIVNNGPIAREPCINLQITLDDIKLHEDAIHRGPAQVLPAVRDGTRGSMKDAKPILYEPLQILQIDAPANYMGEISKLIQNRRGQLLDMTQETDTITVKAKLPVAEMFGLTSSLRSATEGRGTFSVIDQTYEKLPYELQDKISTQIRTRKGLKMVNGIAMKDN